MILKKNFYFPSLAEMIFLSVFMLVAFVHGQSLLIDCDTGYHIRAGEWIIEHLRVPRADMFSFHSPPIPWTAHEWLAEVIMALLHRALGLTGVAIFFAAVIALVSGLLYRMLRTFNVNVFTAVFVVLFATAASQVHWLARPHAFSFLFFLAWLWLLEEFRLGIRSRLFLLPLLLLLWVNIHGGFVAGLLLTGIYLAGELPEILCGEADRKEPAWRRVRSLALVILACLPVACLNPSGWRILLFPFNLVGNTVLMNFVNEFMSPNFHEPLPFKYLLLFIVAIIALARHRLFPREILLLLVFLDMSLYSARYIPLFALATAPMAARITDLVILGSRSRAATVFRDKSEGISQTDSTSGGIVWQVAALGLVAWSAVSGTPHYEFDPKLKPVQAVRFALDARLPGNVFNDDEFGDYLIYAAWPRVKVFFDGRSDMYGNGIVKEYSRVMGFEPGWEKILDKYRINWILIGADAPLSRLLICRGDWALIYRDKVADIFVRNVAGNRAIIERYRPATREGAATTGSPGGKP